MKDKNEIRKNINLPKETVEDLTKLAEKERMKVKPYIEKVLIEHPKKIKKS